MYVAANIRPEVHLKFLPVYCRMLSALCQNQIEAFVSSAAIFRRHGFGGAMLSAASNRTGWNCVDVPLFRMCGWQQHPIHRVFRHVNIETEDINL